jgi:hypothetical protein
VEDRVKELTGGAQNPDLPLSIDFPRDAVIVARP